MVKVSEKGKSAITQFRPIKIFKDTTLLEAKLLTGRTHQIRVHAAEIGHPIAGDEKYGDKIFNQRIKKLGLKRLFLHAAGISYQSPDHQQMMGVCAIMDSELQALLRKLK